jgi:hypothetical protein
MSDKSNSRGKDFEYKVLRLLNALKAQSPARVRVSYQIKFTLNNQKFIPDFEFQYDMPPTTHCLLVECQARKRTSTPIANKIHKIQCQSNRNRFMVVYDQEITAATRNALDNAGVVVLSFMEFKRYIPSIRYALQCIKYIHYSKYVIERRVG